MSTGRRALAFALFAAAGCQTAASPSDSDASVGDASIPVSPDLGGPVVIYGKFASELSLEVTLDRGDAGTVPSGIEIPAVWVMQSRDDGSKMADGAWELCDLPVPGLVDLSVETLDPAVGFTSGPLSAIAAGAHIDFPQIVFLLGAQVGDKAKDPLPTAAAPLCSDTITVGCTVPDAQSGLPGVPVSAAGLDPDVDLVYLDLRLTFGASFDLTVAAVDGTITSSPVIESHVLACHLAAGGPCASADVARLEALRARVTVSQATVRSHLQGIYFTCPQMLSDREGALGGVETPIDGGVADIDVSPPTFSRTIQPDLDARGCATGGCHEAFNGPKMMHLVFQPDSPSLLMQNYQQVLPWTSGSPPGGRFANEVPLPTDMRARWLQWIQSGAPF